MARFLINPKLMICCFLTDLMSDVCCNTGLEGVSFRGEPGLHDIQLCYLKEKGSMLKHVTPLEYIEMSYLAGHYWKPYADEVRFYMEQILIEEQRNRLHGSARKMVEYGG